MVTLVNRAKMTTATTGTGTLTLGTASDGFQSFADAGITNGQTVRYTIEDGSDWEIGTGTYTASGTTLTRSVDESSNADAPLNLTGAATVFVVASSLDIQQPPSEGAFVDGDKTKLDGIETNADVTDTANVTAAGALMDSELTSEAAVKALDQGVATTDDPTFTNTQLAAIAETKADTAVDVFVYDTSKDSDGGAWRKRTQGTSWYNETLNTATRGSRREFPAVAVIVAESDKVTIYDGDDPSLPMWMVFSQTTSPDGNLNWWRGGRNASSVAMVNGVFVLGQSLTSVGGIGLAYFASDALVGIKEVNAGSLVGLNISQRNLSIDMVQTSDGKVLASNAVNDVAMTVLPDAPIDPATGLPVPTILVGTDGNGTYSTSIITDSGDVYDIASDSTGTAVSVAFDGVSLSVVRSDGTVYVWDNAGSITADGASPDATYSASSTPALLGTVSEVAA